MSDLSQLQREKAELEAERDRIVAAIHELRARARQKSIEASVTRVPLPESEIQYWKTNIAKHQAELMEVQGKLGALNKAIRAAGPARQVKNLAQLPPDVTGKDVLGAVKDTSQNDADIQAPGDLKEGHILFLQFFRQLVVENIDPRMVKVFEKDAHNLVNDHRRMHGGRSQ